MPIYEYLCESCGKVNERLQKVNDPAPRSCDECGGRKLAKLVSRSAFQLKGGGWYSDLYATPRKKDGGGAGAGGEGAGAAPAEGAAKDAGKADKADAAPGDKAAGKKPAPAAPPPASTAKPAASPAAGKKRKA